MSGGPVPIVELHDGYGHSKMLFTSATTLAEAEADAASRTCQCRFTARMVHSSWLPLYDPRRTD